MLYRYSRWDGSQQVSPLDPDAIVDAIAEDLVADGDVYRALRRILQRGLRLTGGDEVRGLQQLLERLRALRQRELERYKLSSVVDDLAKRLADVVETERRGIRRRLEQAPQAKEGEEARLRQLLESMAAKKLAFLDALPQDMGGAIRALSDYDFMEPEAREKFRELLALLQQKMMESFFQGLSQGIQGLTPEELARIREMVRDLNRLLRERMEGGEPDFEGFMSKHGRFFGPGVRSLEELIEQMQRRRAMMQSLLESMPEEMRRNLAQMMDAVLRDDRLKWDLALLGSTLEQLYPMGRLAQEYPFRGEEPLTLAQALDVMGRLQEMDQMERQLRSTHDMADLERLDADKLAGLLGEGARQDLERLKELAKLLEEAGYIARKGDGFELTPRAIRRIGQRALEDIFAKLKKGSFGKHPTHSQGVGGERVDDTKPYEFGDPFLPDLGRTLMNSLVREGAGTPVRLRPGDFEVYRTEYRTQSATVMMLDMSRSMVLRGLFKAAKKVALALHSLIRSQYPRDRLYIIGFSYSAMELKPEDLPQIAWNEYLYGTNMQHGLMLARQLLSRCRSANKQIIMITDGEPTAHLEEGEVYFSYPPTYKTVQETLREVGRCTKENIVINTFMLDSGRSLANFVEEITRINRGRAFYTAPEHLGEYILVDYVANKTTRQGRGLRPQG